MYVVHRVVMLEPGSQCAYIVYIHVYIMHVITGNQHDAAERVKIRALEPHISVVISLRMILAKEQTLK